MTQQSTTSNNWNDFNDAESQQSGFDLIPKGTVVPVRMTLKPGGYDDPSQGWGGGYATESFDTGSIYLAAEFVVTAPEYVEVAIKRFQQNHPGVPVTLLATGQSFEQVAAERFATSDAEVMA